MYVKVMRGPIVSFLHLVYLEQTEQPPIKAFWDNDPNHNEAAILGNNHGTRKIHTEVVVVDYTVPEGKNKTKLVMVYNQMGYLSTYVIVKEKEESWTEKKNNSPLSKLSMSPPSLPLSTENK